MLVIGNLKCYQWVLALGGGVDVGAMVLLLVDVGAIVLLLVGVVDVDAMVLLVGWCLFTYVFWMKVGSPSLHSSKTSFTFTVISPKFVSADLNAFFFRVSWMILILISSFGVHSLKNVRCCVYNH